MYKFYRKATYKIVMLKWTFYRWFKLYIILNTICSCIIFQKDFYDYIYIICISYGMTLHDILFERFKCFPWFGLFFQVIYLMRLRTWQMSFPKQVGRSHGKYKKRSKCNLFLHLNCSILWNLLLQCIKILNWPLIFRFI